MTSESLTHRLVTHVATPIVNAVFVVLAISGLMMFFHVGEPLIKEMHEWFGITFVAASSLHIYRNRKAIFVYFKKAPLRVASVATAVAAAGFLIAASMAGPPGAGAGAMMRQVEQATLAELAPILDTTPGALVDSLRAQGYRVDSADQSLATVARASGFEPRQAIGDLFGGGSGEARRQGRGGGE
ncbi:MAG: DUF4405 domain-containing protein [Deltaproteobacteria bacterium]|nr:DUF4405 domain-containing protein [Deltaproteobacteria bacterium]